MDPKTLKQISKRISYVLRHRPDSVGIELGDGGWARADELLACFLSAGNSISRKLLDVVVAENDKQRFEFSADGTLIRARQGHSLAVDLGYNAAAPPNVLYHGTATKNLDSIFQSGLVKGRRHHVHLSTNQKTVLRVGMRHGKPVLLAIDAHRMRTEGNEFFVTGNKVWLTDHVPPECIRALR